MVRNIPILYTLDMLLQEWPNNGEYDFLYLPFSCVLRRNLSYAFINFTSQEKGHAFKQQWQKKRLAHCTARKPLNISYAEFQGRDANLTQLKEKRTRRRTKMLQCEPVVFQDGALVSFAEALQGLESGSSSPLA